MRGLALAAAFLVGAATPAQAQDHHPPPDQPDPYVGYKDPYTGLDCCHGQHCRPIPANDVRQVAAGYLVKTRHAQDGWALVPFARVIWADPDNKQRYHKCEDAMQLRCFIAPPLGT